MRHGPRLLQRACHVFRKLNGVHNGAVNATFSSEEIGRHGVPSIWAAGMEFRRHASNLPETVVYSGPKDASKTQHKRVTVRELAAKYHRGDKITMCTAYDYPSAVHVEEAGIDVLLVGDSVGMVQLGYDTTLPVTVEDMLLHCRAVARGASIPLLVGDMPFGSYEGSSEQAVTTAIRFLKEGHMDAVKLEGGSRRRVNAVEAIADAGIAVMGHVGLTPQSISILGGFRPRGGTAEDAMQVLHQALELQRAGCFSLVLECLPAPVAAAITKAVAIPTIGIGAGWATSGQVLVYHDLLGMMQHPHHAKVTPRFCKQYAQVGTVIQGALRQYRDEVTGGSFPSIRHSPYKLPEKEMENFVKSLQKEGLSDSIAAVSDTISHPKEEPPTQAS
eukprot:jgi/Mesvir1/8895/Mv02778-RA.1